MNPVDMAALREEYETAGVVRADLAADPLAQFERWFDEAHEAGVYEPNAMVLSTVDTEGAPDSRVVLLKGLDSDGLVFYTNYRSAKAAQIDTAGAAALNFAWLPLHRQVRLRGTVDRVDPARSDEYFAQRPRGSQIGAWASQQSSVAVDRGAIEAAFAAADTRFDDDPIDRPPHWGGFRLRPTEVEFWQGRRNRLHDRLRYRRDEGEWVIERLQP